MEPTLRLHPDSVSWGSQLSKPSNSSTAYKQDNSPQPLPWQQTRERRRQHQGQLRRCDLKFDKFRNLKTKRSKTKETLRFRFSTWSCRRPASEAETPQILQVHREKKAGEQIETHTASTKKKKKRFTVPKKFCCAHLSDAAIIPDLSIMWPVRSGDPEWTGVSAGRLR